MGGLDWVDVDGIDWGNVDWVDWGNVGRPDWTDACCVKSINPGSPKMRNNNKVIQTLTNDALRKNGQDTKDTESADSTKHNKHDIHQHHPIGNKHNVTIRQTCRVHNMNITYRIND